MPTTPKDSTSPPPTLAEFLLAQIAEDEAAFRADFALGEEFTLSFAHMLADCEAKRRAVAACEGDLRDRGDGALDGLVDRPTWDVLCALATAYADRPDYREEWKP